MLYTRLRLAIGMEERNAYARTGYCAKGEAPLSSGNGERSVGWRWVKGMQPEPDHIYRAKEEETDMERNDTTRNARIAKGEVLSGAFGKYVAE
jgi:hypothetical protein